MSLEKILLIDSCNSKSFDLVSSFYLKVALLSNLTIIGAVMLFIFNIHLTKKEMKVF